jgi:isopentenyl-diphosphate delta-isomerase
MTDDHTTRKKDHLRLALHDPRTQRPGRGNGLDRYRFEALSLPELHCDQIDTACTLLGKTLRAPLLVGAMTGGTDEATAVNKTLAEAAERCGVGFCLGSQRSMIDMKGENVARFLVRDVAPRTLLVGNIGAIQLRDHLDGAGLERLGLAIGTDAMFVHLNPLQEAVQKEGDRDWRGVLDALGECAAECNLPVLAKEVGAGLSEQTLRVLAATGIAGVETAGVGGTSWSQLEALRHESRTLRAIAGEVLADFGTPTAESIVLARRALPRRIVIGSGGLRTGLDVAKCIALGADASAMAWPFLRAAKGGVEAVANEIEGVIETLRVVMFLCGAPDLLQLRMTTLHRDVEQRDGAHLAGFEGR